MAVLSSFILPVAVIKSTDNFHWTFLGQPKETVFNAYIPTDLVTLPTLF